MSISITPDGRTIHWIGECADPASSTVGMSVALASRSTTADERTRHAEFLGRIAIAPVNPTAGVESYGDAHNARDAWISSLPRVAA